jgi:hypothetical protein
MFRFSDHKNIFYGIKYSLMHAYMCDKNRDETLVHNITKQQNKPNVEHTVRFCIVQGIQISFHLGHITAIDL